MRDTTKDLGQWGDNRASRDTDQTSKFKPLYRPPPRLTPSVRLARRVIQQLHSQLGSGWRDRLVDGRVTITITLDAPLIDRAIWEFSGSKKQAREPDPLSR